MRRMLSGRGRGLAAVLLLGPLSLAGCGEAGGQSEATLKHSEGTQAPVKPPAKVSLHPEATSKVKLATAAAEDGQQSKAEDGQQSKSETSTLQGTSAMLGAPGTDGSLAGEPEATIDDLLDEAEELAHEGKPQDAIARYLEVATRDTKSAVPQVEIARLYIKLNQAKSAKAHAQKAVELEPSWSTAWNTLGRAELLARKLDDAAAAFNKATEANPKNLHAWNNLGLVRLLQKRPEEAADALEKATSGDGAVAFMFNNLGAAYEQLGRLPAALAAYKQGLVLGSQLAGKNFVRIERLQGLERTAQHVSPNADPAEAKDLDL